MNERHTEGSLFDGGQAAWACLPVQGIATLAQIWCWQLEAMGQIASLSLTPWRAVMGGSASEPSLVEELAARSMFDLAFCLGAAGEARPFPE